MTRVWQYNTLSRCWDVYEFPTRDEAIHYVASYRIIGWRAQHIYIETEAK